MTATLNGSLPYELREMLFGTVTRQVKVYPGERIGDIVEGEELAIWQYARSLEERVKALGEENEALRMEIETRPTVKAKGGK